MEHSTNENIRSIIEQAKNRLKQIEDSKNVQKKQVIMETVKQLEDNGVPKEMISDIMSKELEGYASSSYIRQCLSDEYKDAKKQRLRNTAALDDKKPIEVTTIGTQEPSTPTVPSKGTVPMAHSSGSNETIVYLDLTNPMLWSKTITARNNGLRQIPYIVRDGYIVDIKKY